MRSRVLTAVAVVLATLVLSGVGWLAWEQSEAMERERTARASSQPREGTPSVSTTPVPTQEFAPMTGPNTIPSLSKDKRMANLKRLASEKAARLKASAAAPEPSSFRISAFNILGSQHTVRGAQRASMAPGTVRAGWAAQLISGSGADILGFSELQPDQYSVLMSRLEGFAAYPGTALGRPGVATSILWRASRFELVDATYLTINFLGQSRPMPIVLLKDKASERTFYVFNVHNSPVQDRGTHQAQRNAQMASQIAAIQKLRATGVPVFFLGDMNEHAEVFCKVAGATDLTSPAGGSTAGGCQPPGRMRVDWIFGNGTWTGYEMSRSPLVRRITDHAVLFADVTVQ